MKTSNEASLAFYLRTITTIYIASPQEKETGTNVIEGVNISSWLHIFSNQKVQ